MSRIRGKDTGPEKVIRAGLIAAGARGYRTCSSLEGRPDIVFPRAKLAIFIDGCFWHRCPVDYREPATRKEFWARKIASNVIRDKHVNMILTKKGWMVMRFWEHQIRKTPDSVINTVVEYLGRTSSMQ